MTTAVSCPACGTPLSGDTPEGLCPACLLAPLAVGPESIGLASSAGIDLPGTPSITSALSVPHVDGYQILRPLGEGGMGTVWLALQRGTRREVALKLLGSAAFGSRIARLRFEREVELAARLEHPHIARIYESGVSRGDYYYAMERVDGLHLDRHARDNALSRRQIVELMRDVCRAVQYAHQRGIIHRDLKPSNVLVTRDGQPRVVDFGLARSLDDRGEGLTAAGEGAGTLAFMSPEQAAGRNDLIDTRTDVYGLGATLYLLLTDRPPHDLEGPRHHVLRRVAEGEVRLPRQRGTAVGRELEAILLKALAKDPEHRYASAGQLADDLEHWLRGEPLSARSPSILYLLRKRARRHWPSLLAAAVALLMAVMILVLYAEGYRIHRKPNGGWSLGLPVNGYASRRETTWYANRNVGTARAFPTTTSANDPDHRALEQKVSKYQSSQVSWSADGHQAIFAAEITADSVLVRSWAGADAYPTLVLHKGDHITAVDGICQQWLPILPPEGSFAYIPKQYVNRLGDGHIGRATKDVMTTAGSSLSDMKAHLLAAVHVGQEVEILGEQDEYFKIKPPPGSYFYVESRFIHPLQPATRPAVPLLWEIDSNRERILHQNLDGTRPSGDGAIGQWWGDEPGSPKKKE